MHIVYKPIYWDSFPYISVSKESSILSQVYHAAYSTYCRTRM